MKKKNGFTLIELLAVIVILAVVGVIGAVATISIKEKMNTKMFSEQLQEIITAAETYGSDNKEIFDELATNSDNFDQDLEKTVMKITVQNLLDSGYEKVEGTPKQIIDPNTGTDIKDLVITVYETNDSGRVRACIKNDMEDQAPDNDAENAYKILTDGDKSKYPDVYCFTGENLDTIINDRPSIKVLTSSTLLNEWTSASKKVDYIIRDKSSNLSHYAYFEKSGDKSCSELCDENTTWTAITNADQKKDFQGTLNLPTTLGSDYLSESTYCICAKDSAGNSNSGVVTGKNFDPVKPQITSLTININNKRITGGINPISSRNGDTYERYNNIKYTVDHHDGTGEHEVTADALLNTEFTNACNTKPTIKATLTSKAGITSDVYTATVNVTGCIKLNLYANGGSFTGGATSKNYDIGTSYTVLDVPTRTNYSLIGWATTQEKANSGVTDFATANPQLTISNSTTEYNLYAVWQYNIFSISYVSNLDGVTNPSSKTQTNNRSFTVPSLSKANAVFLGWATYPGASTAEYPAGSTINITGNSMTLYGVWKTFTYTATKTQYNLVSTGTMETFSGTSVYVTSGDPTIDQSTGKVTLKQNYKVNSTKEKGGCIEYGKVFKSVCVEYSYYYATNAANAVGKWIYRKSSLSTTKTATTGETIYQIISGSNSGTTVILKGMGYKSQITTTTIGTYTSKYNNSYPSTSGSITYTCNNC